MIERLVSMDEGPEWLTPPRSRRIAVHYVNDEALTEMFKPGVIYRVVANGLPPDARVVGVKYEVVRGGWAVYLESATFAEVPEAETPPPLPAVMVSMSTDGGGQ